MINFYRLNDVQFKANNSFINHEARHHRQNFKYIFHWNSKKLPSMLQKILKFQKTQESLKKLAVEVLLMEIILKTQYKMSVVQLH